LSAQGKQGENSLHIQGPTRREPSPAFFSFPFYFCKGRFSSLLGPKLGVRLKFSWNIHIGGIQVYRAAGYFGATTTWGCGQKAQSIGFHPQRGRPSAGRAGREFWVSMRSGPPLAGNAGGRLKEKRLQFTHSQALSTRGLPPAVLKGGPRGYRAIKHQGEKLHGTRWSTHDRIGDGGPQKTQPRGFLGGLGWGIGRGRPISGAPKTLGTGGPAVV